MSDTSNVKCVLGVREKVIDNCWHYLYDNFHKFTDANKLKVILAICPKNIPQKVEGMNQSQIVMMGEVKKDDQPMRFNIGSAESKYAYSPEHSGLPGQASTSCPPV